jgi:hypothetical protein
MAWPTTALAQQSGPPVSRLPSTEPPPNAAQPNLRVPQLTQKLKSPGEIAEASRVLAQKKETCRRQAKEEKLKVLKRHRFIRDCVKKQ